MKRHAGILQVETLLKSRIELCWCQGSVEWRKRIGAGARSSRKEGRLLSHGRHWALRCTFSDHREDANGIKGQSLLIGSGAAQKAAIPDPADLLRKLDFVIRATVSVSQQLRVVVCALLRRSEAAPGLLPQLGTPLPLST